MKSEMYDKMFELEQKQWYFRSKREIVLSLIESLHISNPKIIDLGCGCGLMLKSLSTFGSTTGVDFSQEALDYCRNDFDGELICGNLENIVLERKYNLALALDVLEHISDDSSAVKSIYTILENNGYCIFTVPAFNWLWSKHDENCMHKRRYSRDSLIKVLTASGFSIQYASYYNFFLFPAAVLVRLFSNVFGMNQDSKVENAYKEGCVNNLLHSIFSSEKVAVTKGIHMPFGLSIICLAKKGEISSHEEKMQ